MRRLLPIILVATALAAGVYVGYSRRSGIPRGSIRPTLALTFLESELGGGVLVQPLGGPAYLVDPGPAGSSDGLVSYLRSAGVAKVRVVLTDPSRECGGSLAVLADGIGVTLLLHGKWDDAPRGWRRSLEAIRARKIPEVVLQAGRHIGLSTSSRIESMSSGRSSDSRLVLGIVCGRKRFLLASSADLDAEAAMICSGADLRASVLVTAGGVSREFLSRVRPGMCIVSSGACGKRLTRSELQNIRPANTGATLYTTDEHGTIRLVTDGRSIEVDTGPPR